MKKKLDVNGDALRREREKRALTQDELSERTRLGVRTLRRLEAGQGTLETLKRVTDALAREPEVDASFEPPAAPDHQQQIREVLRFDVLALEVSSDLLVLCGPDGALQKRVRSIRRHIGHELGFGVPPVRFRDSLQFGPNSYRIRVRERVVAEGEVRLGQLLAIGREQQLAVLEGTLTKDPTYGMPGVWVDEALRDQAQAIGAMIFDPVSVIATHLTETIRGHAHRLLGIDEVQELLDILDRPALVAELVPGKVSLTVLRSVLRNLLVEAVSIRDLGLILETLADHARIDTSAESLTELARVALGPTICREYANSDGQINAIVLESGFERRLESDWERLRAELKPQLEAEMATLCARGLQPIVVSSPALRLRLRALQGQQLVCLSRVEIADGLVVHPVALLGG